MKNIQKLEELIIQYSSSSPVGRLESQTLTGLPVWAEYFFGSLFIVLGLLLLVLSPYNNKSVKEYQKKQLEQYKKENKIKTNLTYDQAKLITPLGKKFKQVYAPVVGITFVVIGISWMIGRTI